MNFLLRMTILISAVTAMCLWPSGLTFVLFFVTPVVLVMIEQFAQPKPQRIKRHN